MDHACATFRESRPNLCYRHTTATSEYASKAYTKAVTDEMYVITKYGIKYVIIIFSIS